MLCIILIFSFKIKYIWSIKFCFKFIIGGLILDIGGIGLFFKPDLAIKITSSKKMLISIILPNIGGKIYKN